MAAAAAAGNNDMIRLNVVVMVTQTLPENGCEDTMMNYRVFTLPHAPLLRADTAAPLLRDVVGFFSVPMDPAIVEKVVESACHLLLPPPLADGEAAADNDGAPPLTTVEITVDHGVVSVVGDFDEVSDEEDDSDSDWDDEDGDDGGEGEGEGMEVQVEVKVEEAVKKME
ncbi:unnamed protein product [Linum trigynum]|uniref:Uncharacterized protein n=1 Tax=Linum trigynum TaxID=586398 RepID=A0AAV2GH62_9ROSI